MTRASFVLLLLVSVFMVSSCSRGNRPVNTRDGDNDRVEHLGQRRVDFKGDRDTIQCSLRDGTFHAIRIEVEGSELEMWDIDVHFLNGGHQDVDTRLHFAEGSWSRRIDLRGGARGIDKVVFKYKSKKPRTGKATIHLYGIH